MGLSVGAVKGRLFHGRKKLRQTLERYVESTRTYETRALRTQRSVRGRAPVIFELPAGLLRERTTRRRNIYGQQGIDVDSTRPASLSIGKGAGLGEITLSSSTGVPRTAAILEFRRHTRQGARRAPNQRVYPARADSYSSGDVRPRQGHGPHHRGAPNTTRADWGGAPRSI